MGDVSERSAALGEDLRRRSVEGKGTAEQLKDQGGQRLRGKKPRKAEKRDGVRVGEKPSARYWKTLGGENKGGAGYLAAAGGGESSSRRRKLHVPRLTAESRKVKKAVLNVRRRKMTKRPSSAQAYRRARERSGTQRGNASTQPTTAQRRAGVGRGEISFKRTGTAVLIVDANRDVAARAGEGGKKGGPPLQTVPEGRATVKSQGGRTCRESTGGTPIWKKVFSLALGVIPFKSGKKGAKESRNPRGKTGRPGEVSADYPDLKA